MEIANLFVYGTLRRGFGNRMSKMLRRSSVFVGQGCVRGLLYNIGTYPGLVTGAEEVPVRGEVYAIQASDVLDYLDWYEGCEEHPWPLFERRQVTVELDDGTKMDAWAYFYGRSTRGLQLIESGDYLAWQEERNVNLANTECL